MVGVGVAAGEGAEGVAEGLERLVEDVGAADGPPGRDLLIELDGDFLGVVADVIGAGEVVAADGGGSLREGKVGGDVFADGREAGGGGSGC